MSEKIKAIRGNAGSPERILQWLKDQGAKNSIEWISVDSIYYVNPDGLIEIIDKKHECLFDITKSLLWRAENCGLYWYIDDLFDIVTEYDSHCDEHNIRYERGNYFQSKNEAEEYFSKFVKLLKERK